MVPYDSTLYKRFFCDPPGGLVSPELQALLTVFWMSTWLNHLVRAITMFRPSRAGGGLCVVLTLALITLCSVIHVHEYEYAGKHGERRSGNPATSVFPLLLLFCSPAIYAIGYAWSEKRDKGKHAHLLKAYFLFFGVLMIEVIFQTFNAFMVMPYFFRGSTSTFTRFLMRIFGQVLVFYLGTELSWRFSKQAAKNMGCNVHNATVASFSLYASAIPLLGRIMQGSAETMSQSIFYEVAGTLAELAIADAFLKSRTPLDETMCILKSILGKNSKKKVVPALTRGSLKGVDSWQRRWGFATRNGHVTSMSMPIFLCVRSSTNPFLAPRFAHHSFCETAMIMITIGEAAGLLASSFFWLLMGANPSEPGSPKIPITQTLKTLAIMLIGELVVTDGIIAYVSNKFQKRFIVDLAAAWHDLRTNRKRLIWAFVAVISLTTLPVVVNLPTNMCYTSPAADEANWALTSCPDAPKNVTEMTRVSPRYQAEWEKYN